MRFSRYTSLIFILISGCVEPFNTKTEKTTDQIVVEGSITNKPPPYSVQLTTTANFSQNLDGIRKYVSGATVKVCDDLGQCIPFFEVIKGRYETAVNAPAPEFGRSYHVEIVTAGGKVIKSFPEKMIESPPMKRGYSEFDSSTVAESGFTVYIDTDDPAQVKNYYKWETINYYKYSGYCFSRVEERSIQHLASDKNVDGNVLSRIPVKVVPFTNGSPWLVEVYQLALSASAFEFVDGIRKQANTSGSIFDPPPTYLRGNLYNPDDEKDTPLGYFIVAGVSRLDIVVDRGTTGTTPRPVTPILEDLPLYCGDPCDVDCATRGGGVCGQRPCPPECASIPGNTNIAPASWPYPHNECGD